MAAKRPAYGCRVKLVAESFAWPFRGRRRSTWAAGVLCVLLLPVLLIPLLGYAIAATRAAEQDPSQGPPAWRMSASLLADGFWTALAVLLTLLPFAIAWDPLSSAFFNAGASPTRDPAMSGIYAHVIAFFALALPWGLVALLVLPHATASFAATGKPADLFNLAAAVRGVSRDFAAWNLAAAAIVTGWTIGLACAGLLCVGIVPGIFYAILVSAHAAAALHRSGPNPSAG
ncbi:MAG: DUF4013 domain-containing protein [Chloroflexi bacterium]|nr:MAG: DUF4013 domain-containing protein [Chloroflexota bacterium]